MIPVGREQVTQDGFGRAVGVAVGRVDQGAAGLGEELELLGVLASRGAGASGGSRSGTSFGPAGTPLGPEGGLAGPDLGGPGTYRRGWYLFGALRKVLPTKPRCFIRLGAGTVTFYHDGQQTGQVNNVPNNQPMYLIMGNQCGSSTQQSGTDMLVDWVRAWS